MAFCDTIDLPTQRGLPMMRCRNAEDLRSWLERAFGQADILRATLDRSVRIEPNDQRVARPVIDEGHSDWLECHTRNFLVDHILSALNWNFKPDFDVNRYIEQNIVIEQDPGMGLKDPGYSLSKKLDYLGYESQSNRALLAVEAKGIRMRLSGSPAPEASPDAHPLGAIICESLSHIRGDKDTTDHRQNDGPLIAEWMNAIRQIRNYCLRIYQATTEWPTRAVLTNGDWLILFRNPGDCFNQYQTTPLRISEILVFESQSVLISRCELLWQLIEYGVLSKNELSIGVGEIRSFVDTDEIESCSFGLHLLYQSEQAIDEPNSPLIKISPRIFLRGKSGGIIQIKMRNQEVVPGGGSNLDLQKHLNIFRDMSRQFKSHIETTAFDNRELPVVSVIEHCASIDALRIRPLSERISTDRSREEYIFFTGAEHHYLKADDASKLCDFHCHKVATSLNMATQTQTFVLPTTDPRSYFLDNREHHCRHEYVEQNKSVLVTVQKNPATGQNGNKKFGHRSREVGSAFCLIWPIENYLCCRTCTFHPVCDKAETYSLPCDTSIPISCEGSII